MQREAPRKIKRVSHVRSNTRDPTRDLSYSEMEKQLDVKCQKDDVEPDQVAMT